MKVNGIQPTYWQSGPGRLQILASFGRITDVEAFKGMLKISTEYGPTIIGPFGAEHLAKALEVGSKGRRLLEKHAWYRSQGDNEPPEVA